MTAERWRALVEQQRAGAVSVSAFCRRHGLAVSTYFAWRRRLDDAARSTFVEVTAAVDLRPSLIEVVVAGGARVQVRAGFDTALLRQVVEALQ